MASEEKFDPAAAQAELANLPSQNEITLAGIEALSDNGDLLQLLLTGPAGMPSPGGIVGILGTVSTVISLPAKALLAYNEYTEIKKRYEQPPGPPPPPEGLPGPEGPDDSEDPDALIRKAGALIASERLDDALTVLDDIAARFAADSDQGVARSVRHSRLNALQVLNRLHRWEETLTRYDQIAEIYGADTTPAVSVDMLSARTDSRRWASCSETTKRSRSPTRPSPSATGSSPITRTWRTGYGSSGWRRSAWRRRSCPGR